MNSGKIFENEWRDSVPSNVYYYRLKDPAQSFNQTVDTGLRFSPKNPYDIIMFTEGILFCLELKSTVGTSFSFEGKTPMIKKNQIEGLTKASIHKGIIAGFIFNMENPKINKTYYLPIIYFNKFLSETDKKSINQKDIINYGAIEVIGEVKRTRKKFYIGEFIKKII